jgi:PEP-CTERM motif
MRAENSAAGCGRKSINKGFETMRKLITCLMGASSLAIATQASATTFVFSSGSYIPGTTAPEPLMSPDTLNLTTGSNKFWAGVSFTNQSGTVNWQAGNLFMQNAATINNQSLWNATSDNSLINNGGALSTFTNSGIFQKSGGIGNTTISAIAFINSGLIDAQTGTILFNGNNATFNSGSSFTGAGTTSIGGNAAFNGAFSSTNLDFDSGTYTGTAASLSGSADWSAGSFSGSWDISAGSTLTANSGSNKFWVGSTFTNDGTINWTGGNLFLQNGSQVTNNGTVDASSDNSIINNGGALSTFTNNGVFEKTGGAGATVISAIAFVNNGTIDAQTGSIDFNGGNATFNGGSDFTGAGQVNINSNATFNGGFTSTNLDFENGTFTGNAAALAGTADWSAGSFGGSWGVSGGSTLTANTGSNKFWVGSTFTNDGTINWTGGNLFLQNGSQVTNNGTFDASSSNSIINNGGALSTFTNNGLFEKTAGVGATVISAIAFVNTGTIDAQTGSIDFNGGNATFNAGSDFTGAGQVNINSNATFNGGFTSTNLDFESGTFTGNAAALTGTADWAAGSFAGGWTVNNGATLNVLSGSNKFLNGATLTNAGTVNWSSGNLFLQNASQLVNTGTIAITSDNSIINNGGAASSIVNNGLIEKIAGGGTTTLASGLALDNNGTINVLSGTIALPSAFNNDGTLGGTGTFSSTNLTNDGSIAPGAAGAAGTLSLTGNYIQSATGVLRSQLASTASSDLFRVSGTAGLNGTLALSCILSCAISTGDSFVLLDSIGNLSGTFANITTSGFLNGFTYNVIYDYGSDLVRLDITNAGMVAGGVPEPANWALMIAGFGLAGSAMRRRRAAGATLVLA